MKNRFIGSPDRAGYGSLNFLCLSSVHIGASTVFLITYRSLPLRLPSAQKSSPASRRGAAFQLKPGQILFAGEAVGLRIRRLRINVHARDPPVVLNAREFSFRRAKCGRTPSKGRGKLDGGVISEARR